MTFYVEDIVTLLTSIKVSHRDAEVINSLYRQVNFDGKGYTEKQSKLAIRLCQRYLSMINSQQNKDFTPYLDNPMFRKPIRSIQTASKLISIIDVQNERLIKIEFPYNEELIKRIRAVRFKKISRISVDWNPSYKSWISNLSEDALLSFRFLITEYGFSADEEITSYYNQIDSILDNMSNYIPMLSMVNNTPAIVNATENTPTLTSTDTLESIFEARKLGVTVWDDHINEFIDSNNVDPFTRTFLRHDASSKFFIKQREHLYENTQILKNIVKYLLPTLFLIQQGQELKQLIIAYNLLKDIGIDTAEISVMFRLPNKMNKEFNDFVRDNHLNNPISENTKVVFISNKVPKTILESKIHFNCVVNMGDRSPHWMLSSFISAFPNLIWCGEQPKEYGFVDL